MASLNDIANVDISLNTSTVGKASFGIPLVVSPTTAFTDRLRKYSTYSSAVSDGLDPQTLLALSAIFSQSPRPKIAYVGRRDAATINIGLTSSTIVTGAVYTLSINGESVAYTAVDGDGVDEVLNGLNSAIQADATLKALFGTPVVSDSYLSLPKTDATSSFAVTGGSNLSVSAQGGTSNLATDMEAIKAVDNTWYGWSLVERNDSLISQGAAWTETQAKLFFACTANESVWSSATDDVASQLKSQQYLRTVPIADRNAATQYPDAAVMGRFFTKDPGATVFALKSLASMTPSAFSDTEKGYLIDKNVNTYEQYSDNTYLFGVGTELKASGKVVSGEWIDVVRDRDWLINDIQTSIASVIIRNSKVPYTNAGIALIVSNLRARLKNAQTQGVIAPDEQDSDGNTVPGFKISYPNAADIDADVKASRILYITFDALLAGAIQLVQITGTLSYSYEG
ncbi:Protein of unknown function [Rosenbergiella nectarea]|uniref:Mu-like prophage tail sheath protein gpL n=1 Tax=Rosenbergiella nectarea TaxID=988801 RepID=A0A1H9HQF8_9GAMM|nr:DUF3383 family protein [Rosenbergiella nectarea]SEQ64506.1 Protein of unknown function [Rosenbergiella nectarea]